MVAEANLEHLIRYGKFACASRCRCQPLQIRVCIACARRLALTKLCVLIGRMKCTIMHIGKACLTDELEYTLERAAHIRLLLIMQIQMQIVQVRYNISNDINC